MALGRGDRAAVGMRSLAGDTDWKLGSSLLTPSAIIGHKEIVPRVSRAAVLSNPTNTAHPLLLREAKVAAQSLGVQFQILEARGAEEFESAFATMTRERAGALLVLQDGMFFLRRTRLAELSVKHRLPAMYWLRELAEAGGLMKRCDSRDIRGCRVPSLCADHYCPPFPTVSGVTSTVAERALWSSAWRPCRAWRGPAGVPAWTGPSPS